MINKEEIKDLRKRLVRVNKILAKYNLKLTYVHHCGRSNINTVFPNLTRCAGAIQSIVTIDVDIAPRSGTGFDVVFYLKDCSFHAMDYLQGKYLCNEVLLPVLKDITALNKLGLWTSRELAELQDLSEINS